MKIIFLLAAITFPFGIFAQENVNYFNQIDTNSEIRLVQANPSADEQQSLQGNNFTSNENTHQTKPCKDCEEVKRAIQASHISSGERRHKKSFKMKTWAKVFSGRVSLKVNKVFSRKYKVKTSYAICFNWH